MPLEENTFAYAKDIAFLQVTQERLDMLFDRAYTGIPGYGDHPVALHGKAERPSTWTDVPGLSANSIHCADTLDSDIRCFRRSDAQVVHARLAAIVMNDDRAV